MVEDMYAHAHLEDGMAFNIKTGTGHTVVVDSAVAGGGKESGPRPMELLLVALAGCAGMDMISILRKMRQDVRDYEVRVVGAREEEQPRPFTEITVEHIFTGHEIQPSAVERAIQLTEDRYCGVSAMLGKKAKIVHHYRLIEPA
ncbi:MAG TPA: OsmC family protein [Ktedonobacteraceae bacterium]|jgi:putative redox protein|nr:OsmC family protein [Ktedonobacteraceae bacterium]